MIISEDETVLACMGLKLMKSLPMTASSQSNCLMAVYYLKNDFLDYIKNFLLVTYNQLPKRLIRFLQQIQCENCPNSPRSMVAESENTFKLLERDESSVIIPEGCNKERFYNDCSK